METSLFIAAFLSGSAIGLIVPFQQARAIIFFAGLLMALFTPSIGVVPLLCEAIEMNSYFCSAMNKMGRPEIYFFSLVYAFYMMNVAGNLIIMKRKKR